MEYCSKPSVNDAESLLSEVGKDVKPLSRKNCKLADFSDRFRLKSKNFQRQYAHLYSERLVTLRGNLANAAKLKWGNVFLLLFSEDIYVQHILLLNVSF